MIIPTKKILDAKKRLSPYFKKGHLVKTPIIFSDYLNEEFGHEIYFKAENFQKTGAFKARGVFNAMVALKEKSQNPEIVAYSSGNHGQAIAYAAKILGFKAHVIVSKETSDVKKHAILEFGANLIETETRNDSENLTREMVKQGCHLIHHSDNDHVIAGAAGVADEIFHELTNVSAVFASCGGGGMLSGCYLARDLHEIPECKIIGAEPELANDAARSFSSGEIYRFKETPNTIAEGARTLSVSQRNFSYLQKINDFVEVSENEIIHANAWGMHLLKITIEPTCAVAIAAALKWLKNIDESVGKQKIVIIVSGGNLGFEAYQQIWSEDRLKTRISSIF